MRLGFVSVFLFLELSGLQESQVHPKKCDKSCSKCDEIVQKGLALLVSKQQSDGSWDGKGRGPTPISDTAMCGLALISGGSTPKNGKHTESLSKAVKFLVENIKEDGSVPQKGMETWGITFATWFLWELYKKDPSKEVMSKLKALGERLQALQRGNGGWTHDFDSKKAGHSYTDLLVATNCAVIAMSAIREAGIEIKKQTLEKIDEYYGKAYNEKDGGFKYCLHFPHWKESEWHASERGRTTGGLLALMLLGKKDSGVVKSAVEYVRSDLKNMPASPFHQGWKFELNYLTCALAWHSLGTDNWREFQDTFFEEIFGKDESGSFSKFGCNVKGATDDFIRISTALIIIQLRKSNLSLPKLIKN